MREPILIILQLRPVNGAGSEQYWRPKWEARSVQLCLQMPFFFNSIIGDSVGLSSTVFLDTTREHIELSRSSCASIMCFVLLSSSQSTLSPRPNHSRSPSHTNLVSKYLLDEPCLWLELGCQLLHVFLLIFATETKFPSSWTSPSFHRIPWAVERHIHPRGSPCTEPFQRSISTNRGDDKTAMLSPVM